MFLLIGIPVILSCGFWWAFGGDHGSAWRMIFVPVTIAIGAVVLLGIHWLSLLLIAISCIALGGAITLGYGIPDDPNDPNPDEGSPIGRFWYETAGEFGYTSHEDKARVADIITRGTVGLAYSSAISILCFIKGHYFLPVIIVPLCIAYVILVNCFKGDTPPIEIGSLDLNSTEFMTGSGIGLFALLALL